MFKFISVKKIGSILVGITLASLTYGQKTAVELIDAYLTNNESTIPLTVSSASTWELVRTTPATNKEIQHHYIRQTINGLPVLNATAVFVQKNQSVMLSGNRFVFSNATPSNSANKKEPVACLNLAWTALTSSAASSNNQIEILSENKFSISNPDYSRQQIPVELAYYFDGSTFRLIYEISIEMKDGDHWWDLYVDASTGEIVEKTDWVVSCSNENYSQENQFKHQSLQQKGMSQLMMMPPPPPQNDSYRVFEIPTESPNHGPRTLAVGPFNAIASPFGWHDDNGVAGQEYTTTRGNNVRATEDANDDNLPGYSPDGGANLIFDFQYSAGNPDTYLDAAITNLFYMNNIMHDVWYLYGFDEESGNFQENNYGQSGFGGDFVNADAQDGSGTNNANFSTPPDGSNPRMQMYIWTDSPTSEYLVLNSPSTLAGGYASSIASFAPQPPVVPITEDIIMVNSGGTEPMDACNTIINSSEVFGKIALVKRGSCTFAIKTQNCQNAGALAVIVINNTIGAPITMGGTPTGPINIPAIMIYQADGNSIINSLNSSITVNGSISDAAPLSSTDSDLDNMVIAHEYGHGISNRLTGGPDNTNCLNNEDQMGEGWSDWFGLILTIEPGDLGTDIRGVGTYVQNESTTGPGIRPAPYSTDFSVNGYTYDATNSSSISMPHGIGFVWCTALWDLTWDFIEEYGFDANVYSGTGGNNKMMELVIEAMKLQPCFPGAVDGRDAILLADQLLNNGANECLIWKAFAKRGLGFNASQGDSDDRTDQFENFSVPQICIADLEETDAANQLNVYPNPTNSEIYITSISQPIQSISIQDINGRTIQVLHQLNTKKVEINFSDFPAGIYFVVVQQDEITTTRKVIKK
ncbi:MAG: T9SS-dependent M36 family metallopeptidase [Crocinitomicaceae bacterium]